MLKAFSIITVLSMVFVSTPAVTADPYPLPVPGSTAASASPSLVAPNQPLCFMETTSGQIVDLTALCGHRSTPEQTPRSGSAAPVSRASGSAPAGLTAVGAAPSPAPSSAPVFGATPGGNRPCYFLDSEGRPCGAQ